MTRKISAADFTFRFLALRNFIFFFSTVGDAIRQIRYDLSV